MTVQVTVEVEHNVDTSVPAPRRWPILGLALLIQFVAVISGHSVVGPVAVVGALAVVAAAVDERTGRIPNRLCLMGLASVLAAMPFVAFQGGGLQVVTLSIVAGIVVSGAPLLFSIWLVRPDLIGGGDWKLLGVLGATLGLLSPLSAAVAAFVACLVQFVRLNLRRRRSIPFAPGLAVGFVTAVATAPVLSAVAWSAP